MEKNEIKAIIEGLLFTWGDPIELDEIAAVLEMNKIELEKILKELIDELDNNNRGLRIIRFDNSYQIGTRPEHYDWIKKLNYKKNTKALTNASLETLSIIAYKQPIIKPDIDAIRGVKSDRSITTLIERNLIKELGRMDRPGKPIIYGTTNEFLKSFGIESLEDLPNIEMNIKKNTD